MSRKPRRRPGSRFSPIASGCCSRSVGCCWSGPFDRSMGRQARHRINRPNKAPEPPKSDQTSTRLAALVLELAVEGEDGVLLVGGGAHGLDDEALGDGVPREGRPVVDAVLEPDLTLFYWRLVGWEGDASVDAVLVCTNRNGHRRAAPFCLAPALLLLAWTTAWSAWDMEPARKHMSEKGSTWSWNPSCVCGGSGR